MIRNRSGYTRLQTSDEVSAGGRGVLSNAAFCRWRSCCFSKRRFHEQTFDRLRTRPLTTTQQQDWHSEEDLRFTAPPEEVPWGSVALALFLTVFGVVSFVLAWLHFTQQLFGKEQAVS